METDTIWFDTIQPDNCWVVSYEYKSCDQEEALEVMNNLVKGLNSHGEFNGEFWVKPPVVTRKAKHDEY